MHKYHKSCSPLILTVSRLLTFAWAKNSKSSYLRGVKCTSVTNRVLSSFDRFTAYYKCTRKNFKNLISPWVQCRSITKSCSQIIWPSHGLFQLYEIKLKKSHNFVSSVHKYHKSFSQLPWPIFGFLQLYEEKLKKFYISVSSVHKYHNSCFQIIWPFYGFLQRYEVKLQKSHISVSSVHKYHKSCS